MDSEDRLIASHQLLDDEKEISLRPKHLEEFVGQKAIKENLSIFIDAAKKRDESIEHLLFYGPPGLGNDIS